VRKRFSQKGATWTSAAARRLLTLAGNASTIEDAVRTVVGRLLEGVSCPPTDLEAVAARLEVTGFQAEDLPISGELRRDERGLKIFYSSYLSRERRRFTIAHELGHAIFETTGPNCPRVGVELERLCNMLATELLMPKDVFLNSVGMEVNMAKIFELARSFATSLSATAIRCAELHKVSVFESDESRILWGYGLVKKGLVAQKDDEIRWAVGKALTGEAGQQVVFLHTKFWSGHCRLEWAPIAQGERALFLLHPLKASLMREEAGQKGGMKSGTRNGADASVGRARVVGRLAQQPRSVPVSTASLRSPQASTRRRITTRSGGTEAGSVPTN
jgi:IrrE N-terminal-like domain